MGRRWVLLGLVMVACGGGGTTTPSVAGPPLAGDAKDPSAVTAGDLFGH